MSCVPCALRPHQWLALFAVPLVLPCASAQDALPPASVAPAAAVMRPAPGVQIQYEPLAPDAAVPGAGRLDGSLETGAGTLRGSVRIDPGAGATIHRLDANWEKHLPGPIQTLVLGETHGSGGGWSQPVALTGLRFGRPLALRAATSVIGDPGLQLPGFTAGATPHLPAFTAPGAPQLKDASGAALQDTRALVAPGSLASGPAVRGPETLASGASDYEVELGRVRDQPAGYAAAGWRFGLAEGLTAEARGEWMAERMAHGVEVVQSLAGGTLQATLAQSAALEQSGLRWGMDFVRSGEGADWSLGYGASERGFTTVAGGIEPRSALRAGTRWSLGRRATADLSYTRSLAWDAAEPDAALRLAAQLPLAQRVNLSVGLSLQEGAQAGWGAAMSLSMPLQP